MPILKYYLTKIFISVVDHYEFTVFRVKQVAAPTEKTAQPWDKSQLVQTWERNWITT